MKYSGVSSLKDTYRGYTLLELVAVLAILSILSLMVMPLVETTLRVQKEAELRQSLWLIRDAIDQYRLAKKSLQPDVLDDAAFYPRDLNALVEGVSYAPAGRPETIIFPLRRIPKDPFADTNIPAEKSWRLRSYASGPRNPQPGNEVFDVSSSSTETALDGSRYEDW